MPQILIPAHLREQLLANGATSAAGQDSDPIPVVKLFTPDASIKQRLCGKMEPDCREKSASGRVILPKDIYSD
jgi:hypothetical protein